MDLITILLILVAALMLLTSVLILIGSASKERPRLSWFSLAMFGGTIWTLASGLYVANLGGDIHTISLISYGVCLGSIIASLGLVGHSSPHTKKAHRVVLVLVLLSVGLMIVPLFNFDLLAGLANRDLNGFYIAYGALILVNFGLVLINSINQVRKAPDRKSRRSAILFIVGLLFTLTMSLIFNMILPFVLGIFNFLWIGPLSIYALVLCF